MFSSPLLPAVPPSISGADGDLPEEVTVLVSKEAAMDCVPSGSPSPRITWQKDGQLLAEDDKHMFLSNGRKLQVAHSEKLGFGNKKLSGFAE